MGLGLAIELGQRDIPVVVIERTEVLHTIPKGQNLTQRTMEHFRFWGVEEAVRAARVMPRGYPSVGINAYESLMGGYAHPWFRRSTVDPYYFARNERLPQYLTEAKLRGRLIQLPSVTTLYGTTATGVRQDPEGVIVSTDHGTVAATYVVGCDGSHSMVRRTAGIEEDRSDHNRYMVLIVFRSTELHDLLQSRFGEAAFFNVLHPELDGYWLFLGRVDVGEGWFFHAPVPRESTVENLDHRSLLFAAVGTHFDLELDYVGFWDLRVATADTYREGNLLLAGDSAHSHPPYGGYGINTGLEDARNLGWKMAAVLQGWGGANLLDSYTEERRPVFLSTARDFIEAFIETDRAFIRQHDPSVDEVEFTEAWERRGANWNRGVSRFEPHYEGSSIVAEARGRSPGAVGEHSFLPRTGHHLPPPGPTGLNDRLFESLGQGFALICPDPTNEAITAFQRAAQDLGIPLGVVTSSTVPGVAHYQQAPILVRPDHFVSWVEDDSGSDPGDVLRRSVGQGDR